MKNMSFFRHEFVFEKSIDLFFKKGHGFEKNYRSFFSYGASFFSYGASFFENLCPCGIILAPFNSF